MPEPRRRRRAGPHARSPARRRACSRRCRPRSRGRRQGRSTSTGPARAPGGRRPPRGRRRPFLRQRSRLRVRDPGEQHDHRSEAAGDGIDDAELGPAVGGGEERHVCDLERRRDARYGTAAASTSQRSTASGANASAPTAKATAVAAGTSGRRARARFQPAWSAAAASASASAAPFRARKTRPTGARLMRRTLRHAQPAEGGEAPPRRGFACPHRCQGSMRSTVPFPEEAPLTET